MKLRLTIKRKSRELNVHILVIILASCGPTDDYNNLGHGCLFYGGDGDGIRVPYSYGKSIYGKVIGYHFDQNYIVAKQVPDKQDYISQVSTEFRAAASNLSDSEEKKQIPIFDIMADSVLRTDPYFIHIFSSKTNYWIVNHNKREVIGPMNKKQFIQTFKKLKISKSLMLDNA